MKKWSLFASFAPLGVSRCRSRAFTLIELLVVIAIISILVALLMPTLRGALIKGQQVQCGWGMAELALAYNQYATDHNGSIPSADNLADGWVKAGNTPEAITDGAIYPYVEEMAPRQVHQPGL